MGLLINTWLHSFSAPLRPTGPLSGFYPASSLRFSRPSDRVSTPFREKLQLGQSCSGKLLLRALSSFYRLHLLEHDTSMAHAGLPHSQPQTRTIRSAVLHGTSMSLKRYYPTRRDIDLLSINNDIQKTVLPPKRQLSAAACQYQL